MGWMTGRSGMYINVQALMCARLIPPCAVLLIATNSYIANKCAFVCLYLNLVCITKRKQLIVCCKKIIPSTLCIVLVTNTWTVLFCCVS